MSDQPETNFSCLREKDIAEAFHISTRQVRNWVQSGCPKTSDGYNLFDVHTWLLSREIEKSMPSEGNTLKDRKTQEEINVLQKRQEKMDFDMEELKENTVPKDVHERTILSVIDAFHNFDRNALNLMLSRARAVPDSEALIFIEQFCMDKSKHMVRVAKQAERV